VNHRLGLHYAFRRRVGRHDLLFSVQQVFLSSVVEQMEQMKQMALVREYLYVYWCCLMGSWCYYFFYD
jgi:hypothetical protein